MLGIESTRPYIDAPDIKSSNMSVQTMNPFQDQGGQNFGGVAPMPPKSGMRRQGLWSGGGVSSGMGAGNGGGLGAGTPSRNYASARTVELDMDGRLQGSDYSAVLDRGQVPLVDPFRPSGGGLSSGGGLPSGGGGLARYHSAPGSFLASLAADFQQDSALSSFFADADLPSLNTASDSSLDNMETEPTTSGLFDEEFLVDTRKFERRGNSQLSPGAGGGVVAQKPLQSVYKHSMEVLHENPMGVEQISSSAQISSTSQQMASTTQMSSGLILQGSIPSSMGLVQSPLSSPQAAQKIQLSNLSGNRQGSNVPVAQQVNIGSHLANSPGHLATSPSHLASSPNHVATSPKAGQSPLGLSNSMVGSPGGQMGQALNMASRLTGTVSFSGGLNSDFGGAIPPTVSLGGLTSAGRSNSLLRQSSSPAGLLAQLTIDVPPPTLTKTEKQSLSSPLAHSPDDSLSGGTSEDNSANHNMISGMDIGGWEDVASSYMKSWSNNDTYSMRKRYRDSMDLGDIIVPDTPSWKNLRTRAMVWESGRTSMEPLNSPLDLQVGGSSLEHGPLPGSLTRHMSLPSTKPKASGVSTDDLLQSVPCRIRAKRGCATHPRSIAERVRRTRISERMRKLQELVPNMDKQQTNTADMLDEAVEYVKQLQRQVQELTENAKKCNGSCHLELKNTVS